MDEKRFRIKKENMLKLAEYQRQLREHPRLQFLFFELTDRCNLQCRHCGSNCAMANGTFLPYEDIRKVLKDVAQAYSPEAIMVCLTGGEPMLHPDVYRMIYAARTLGFSVGMTTNGTLIDETAARKLAAAGLTTIAVSIDGVGAVHDGLRRKAGSFGQAMEGIHALRKFGLEAQAITVVHKGNLGHLVELYACLKKEGCYSWRLTNVDPIGRARGNEDLILDAEELDRLLALIRWYRYDPENEMEVTYGCSHFLGFEYENEVRDFYFQCGAGILVGSIMANGDIGACLDIERRPELIQGNIRRDDFVDVWENRYQAFRRNRAEESAVCRDCEHREYCMGDSTHTWDFDRKEPRYCAVKRIKKEG